MSDLERLYERPQQYTNGVTLSQQLDQPGCSEKFQETHVDGVHWLRERERGAGSRERQDVKHRWRNSTQHALSWLFGAGIAAREISWKERMLCSELPVLVFFIFMVTTLWKWRASWQWLTCKSTIISVMLPRTVIKSKIFQVSRK